MKTLALETSTDRLSVALADGERLWLREGAGGAQASATLLPLVRELLAESGLALGQLQAIAFGQGPGSFTGLRTACAVAQGLAQGAALPVLPVPTLLALADEAHQRTGARRVLAALDARMGEVYAAHVDFAQPLELQMQAARAAQLLSPADLLLGEGECLAGNAWPVWLAAGCAPGGLDPGRRLDALPGAAALCRLAPALWQAGFAVTAEQALPLYVRDKVALTSEERQRIKSAGAAGPGNGPAKS